MSRVVEVPSWDQVDGMADGDPLRLRDLAWSLAQEVTRLREAAGGSSLAAVMDLVDEYVSVKVMANVAPEAARPGWVERAAGHRQRIVDLLIQAGLR